MPAAIAPPAPHIALTIAGFDPGGGAGVTADLKVFAAYGVYGVACISALTVQSTLRVFAVEPVSPGLVRQTLERLAEDVVLAGTKIGMLGSLGVVEQVCSFLAAHPEIPRDRIVLDPVACSSSGAVLLEAEGVRLVKEKLLSRVGWVTPNLDELPLLLGEGPIEREQIPGAASRLQTLGGGGLNVVVTGGHLGSPDDFLLTGAGEPFWFPGTRVETTSTHGTGCAFSSALLCALIAGDGAYQAVARSKDYVTGALRSAYPIGKGKGPLHHLFPFDRS